MARNKFHLLFHKWFFSKIENQALRITRDNSTRYEELLVDLEAKCEILNIESVPQLNCTEVDLDYGPSRRLSWNNEENFNKIERFRVRLEYILKQSLNNIHIPNAETLQAHHEFRKVMLFEYLNVHYKKHLYNDAIMTSLYS